jgi:hypothetical protein
MKKLLLSVFALSAFTFANAQCSDLIISEYAEGSNNNKALELYNPSNSAIALNNNYRLIRYNNGTGASAAEANSQTMINLGTHVMQPHEAWVIVIDKRDPAGTGTEIPVDLALQAVADTFLCPVYNDSYTMYFNGNDALSLQKYNGSTWNYVDIFGKIGDAAMTTSNGWSDMFPYDGSAGALWTLNHTLKRKSTVMTGVTTNPTTFIVTTEWDSLPNNTWTGLGSHTCACPIASISEIDNQVNVSVYPNPVAGGTLTIEAGAEISAVEIHNLIGQRVLADAGKKSQQLQISTDGLQKGIYTVTVFFADKSKTIKKITIQ